MNQLKKIRLNSRLALVSPSGEIFMAPFFEFEGVPKGVHPLYISRSKSTAVVAVPDGWRGLPVVYPGRVFAGRLIHLVNGGDEVVVLLSEGWRVTSVEETPEGVGIAGGVYIPLWREVGGAIMARHPSGLWVDRYNNFYTEVEPSTSEPEDEDDI